MTIWSPAEALSGCMNSLCLCCVGAAAERVLQAADQSEGQGGRGQRSRPAG